MKDLVIFGTGGFAREVHQLACDMNEARAAFNILGFLDDNIQKHGTSIHDRPVLGGADWLAAHPGVAVVIGIGSPRVKRLIATRLSEVGAQFATLVHPSVRLGRNIEVGEGSVVCMGNSMTCDIQIGRHAILNLDCTVGHDCVLSDYATVAPSTNLSGNVHVGEGCDIGTNSTVIQGIRIGQWSIVGAGTVVVRDLDANVTAVGTPARIIKQRAAGWHLPTEQRK